MDYARLAALMGTTVDNARRVWEIWIMSKAFSRPTDTLTAEQNQFLAFSLESGLPDTASRKFITGCREYERLRANVSAS
jgi:hypothetical protein